MTLLATHVGSLPRPQPVVDFLFAREKGEAYDAAAFDACMAAAVAENVRRQVAAGIDIVSDGEASKISYATYVKDRYHGFGGTSPRNAPADLKLFPTFLDRLAREGGTPQYARPQCIGPVMSKGQGELQKDIANLKSAMAAHGAGRGFMNAASPGVISLFLQNAHYPTREACLVVCSNVVKRLRPVTVEPTGKVWLESSTDGIHWIGVVAAWTYDDEPELTYEEPLGNGAKYFRARCQAIP